MNDVITEVHNAYIKPLEDTMYELARENISLKEQEKVLAEVLKEILNWFYGYKKFTAFSAEDRKGIIKALKAIDNVKEKTVENETKQECLLDETIKQALQWASNGEMGTSSNTIFAVMTGTVDKSRKDVWYVYNYPHDPDDFRRCLLLLDAVPAWKQRMHEVSQEFPKWTRLVQRWSELESMFKKEEPSGDAPKTYKMIQECFK